MVAQADRAGARQRAVGARRDRPALRQHRAHVAAEPGRRRSRWLRRHRRQERRRALQEITVPEKGQILAWICSRSRCGCWPAWGLAVPPLWPRFVLCQRSAGRGHRLLRAAPLPGRDDRARHGLRRGGGADARRAWRPHGRRRWPRPARPLVGRGVPQPGAGWWHLSEGLDAEAGEWIAANAGPDDRIMTRSMVVPSCYAERPAMAIPKPEIDEITGTPATTAPSTPSSTVHHRPPAPAARAAEGPYIRGVQAAAWCGRSGSRDARAVSTRSSLPPTRTRRWAPAVASSATAERPPTATPPRLSTTGSTAAAAATATTAAAGHGLHASTPSRAPSRPSPDHDPKDARVGQHPACSTTARPTTATSACRCSRTALMAATAAGAASTPNR